MKNLNHLEILAVSGGRFNFSGGGGRGNWGTHMNINAGYTFNPTKNISVTPSVDFQKDRFRGNKITGGGINVNIRF
ncbi:hypothetical protein A4G16_05950 [Mannheimia granulomatis]|uniref:Uncharacterized protein n=1 Tax=Mannheimia granulomatis TaxID=85402 RepID=A0A6G8JIP8_9PAST|nr:hypothetical protein [Mannheimia granulomatis]QIM66946.1 hypothetical protein A4G16_05950 [Mannheimia granulomatis]